MSPVVSTNVRGISAVGSSQRAVLVLPPSDQVSSASELIASSPQCVSGPTSAGSDPGYFGSIGLYEGSCDHPEGDYGRRYSAELVYDTEVFTEHAEVVRSHLPVDSFVTVSRSEIQNTVPSRSKWPSTSDREQFDVAAVDAHDATWPVAETVEKTDHPTEHLLELSFSSLPTKLHSNEPYIEQKQLEATTPPVGEGKSVVELAAAECDVTASSLESNTVPWSEQRDNVVATNLSDEISQSMYSPIDVTVLGRQSSTGDAVGLSEVASRYTTVQLLLEMNQQRSGLGNAENPSFGHFLPEDQPSMSFDRKALASLATNYCVINECLQLGRVGLVSDSIEHGQTLTSEYVDEITEQPRTVEVSSNSVADVMEDAALLKDFNANLSHDGQIIKDTSLRTDEAEQLDESILVMSHKSDKCGFDGGKRATGDLSLMHMANDDPRYYPVYGSLRDIETGVLNTCLHVTGSDVVTSGSSTELVALSEQEKMQRNIRDIQYLDPVSPHSELCVMNYNSLVLLRDVENGNVMPAHKAADVHSSVFQLGVDETSSKQINAKAINGSDAETEIPENQDLSAEGHCRPVVAALDDDSEGGAFTVVKTKKHRRQRKNLDFEEPATQNTSISRSPALSDRTHMDTVQYDDADIEALAIAEPVLSEVEDSTFAQVFSAAGNEECLTQNSSVEVNPCTDEIASVPAMDLEMKAFPVVEAAADEVITAMAPDHVRPQQSSFIEVHLDTRTVESTLTAEGPAEVDHQLLDQNLPGDVVLTGLETLPETESVVDVEDRGQEVLLHEVPTRVAVEPEIRKQVVSDVKTSDIYVAGITVTNVEEEREAAVAAVPELEFITLRTAVPESFASATNETVRVERIITVTPRTVVKVAVESCAEMSSEDIADVTLIEVEHEHEVSATAVAQVEADLETYAAALSKVSQKDVHEGVNALSFSEISESADIEPKTTKVTCLPHDEIKTEKYVVHYGSLAVLTDVESGRVHSRLKRSRFLQEWDAKNVDDIVAYIVGSEAKKHRRKHKRIKRASESEVSEARATEIVSEIMLVSMIRAKSEENILLTDEQTEKLATLTSDVEEQTVEESEDDAEGESFTVVESRKHRRLRHRHDAEEMWAQCLEDVDATAGLETEQSDLMETYAENLHEPAEIVLESSADASDGKFVTDIAVKTRKVTDELSATDAPPELETGQHDALEPITTDASAQYATEEEPEFGHEQDAKQDSLVENADVHISAEVCEPVAESVVKVVPRPLFEVHKNADADAAHPTAATQLLLDESVPIKAADVKLDSTIRVGDGCVAKDNRLYSDVARGKYDVDVLALRETTTDVDILVTSDVSAMHVQAMEASSAELRTECVEDVRLELTSPTEYQLTCEDSSCFLVTSAPESSTDVMADNAGKYVEDVQAELVSDITTTSHEHDAKWHVAETMEKDAHPIEQSLELSFSHRPIELHSNEPYIEQQQPESMAAVPVRTIVELDTSDFDVTASSIEVPDVGFSAEFPPPASDVQTYVPSLYLPTAESPAKESGVESHVLTSCSEISDVGIVSEANVEFSDQLSVEEHIGSLTSDSCTEAFSDPGVELRSSESGPVELAVPILTEEAASDAESTKERTAELHTAEVIPVLGRDTIAEDEKHVADLFSEGVRAVQVRSDSAPSVRNLMENEVDKLNSEIAVTHTVSHSEDALKKSALSSAECFVAEILPYYYAALAVLQEFERYAVHPHDTSLHSVVKAPEAPVKMSHGIMKTGDAGVLTMSADDQASDALPIGVSTEMEESTAGKGGMPETDFNNLSQPLESAVPLLHSKSEHSRERPSIGLQRPAGEFQQSGLQTCSTVETIDKHLLDHNNADVAVLQCHYQSLNLLHSVETGNLSAFSSQMATSSDRTSILVKQPVDDSTDSLTFTSVHKTLRPSDDSLKDISSEEDNVSMSAYGGYQEPQTASSRVESTDPYVSEDLTPVVSLAENFDLPISSADDFANVAQSMHAEHEHNNIAVSIDNVGVSSEYVDKTSYSNLLNTEPTSELPIQTTHNVIEVGLAVKRSKPNVPFLQDSHYEGNYYSCIDQHTAAVRDSGTSVQSPVSIKQYRLPEETFPSDLTEELTLNICDHGLSPQQHQATDAREVALEKHANQDASCFSVKVNEQLSLTDENINVPMSSEDKTVTVQKLTGEKAKKKKNRKKKPRSPKDDLMHPEASHTGSGINLTSAHQSNNISEIMPEIISSATVEARHVDDNGLQITTLVSSETPEGVPPPTSKKNKKRKRRKGAGKLVSDDMAGSNLIGEDTIALPAATTREVEKSTVGRLDVSESALSADVTVISEENDDTKKPAELCSGTQTVGLDASNPHVDCELASCTKPTKKKNRKRRKPKTNNIPSHVVSVEDGEIVKSCDNSMSLDSLVQNRQELDVSVVAEASELMTESLEEDTKIAEQPMDILSVEDSKEMSEASFRFSSTFSEAAAKKKKRRKTKATKVAQPCTTLDLASGFVKENLPEAKDDLSKKDKNIDRPTELSFTSETATTCLPVATLTVTTGELDSMKVSLPTSKDEEWKDAEKETQLEVDSSGESSLDEYQLNVSYATEPAPDSTVMPESFKNRKKKRKRNRQKKISHKTTGSGAETDTDMSSLLIRIVEICSETKDSQAANSGNQPQFVKHDKNASPSVQTLQTARKPRKYKRSKPIRLPPDVAEQSAERMCSTTDKTDVATSATHALHSADAETSRMSPANQLSEESKYDFPETLKCPESPLQVASTDGENIKFSDSTVADDSTVMQNIEETDTVIAWSASSSKMSDQSSEYPWPTSLSHPVVADPCETQVPRTRTYFEDTVTDSDCFAICPSDMTQTEMQQNYPEEDDAKQTFDERHDVTINQMNPWNIDGCMTVDVFTVIPENTNVIDTSDTVDFSSEPNNDADFIKPLPLVVDNQQVPDDDDSIEILDQDSSSRWFDDSELLQAPAYCCETSSVDSEVERIFANPIADVDGDDSSVIEEGVCSDSANDVDDDELALEDSDVVITEYVDVEIIEETETVTVLDNDDDDLLPSVSDRHCPEIGGTPPESKYIISDVSLRSSSGPVQETTGDVMPLQPHSFRFHENDEKHQLTGFPCDVNAENAKAPAVSAKDGPVHDSREECFRNYPATEDMLSFHWPPTSDERATQPGVTEVLGLRRSSRKRQYPSDDTSSSDSGDNKPGSDNLQFILSRHQPASTAENLASDPVPVWPSTATHSQWSASNDVIDAAFVDAFTSEPNLAGEPQVAANPLTIPWQNIAAGIPADFHLEAGPDLVRQKRDFTGDEEDLSGDSLNEIGSSAVDSFFEEPGNLARVAVPLDPVQASLGETYMYESCSSDSLDYQTKPEPLNEHLERRRSSTDCISDDSLREANFATRKDAEDSTVDKGSGLTTTQRLSTKNVTTAANVRRKKFRGVTAKIKYPKPGVAAKTSRKRKLGKVEKHGSDHGETDTDSAELE